jgi:PIN domain nuclease of toxin-antitoxin system
VGVTYLLDTHAVLWIATGAHDPSASTRVALDDPGATFFVSAASALEVATKVRIGKLESAHTLVGDWPSLLERLGASSLPITERHGVAAGLLDWPHRDPFDRLLVAQAAIEGLTLVTADPVVLRAPGVSLLSWS